MEWRRTRDAVEREAEWSLQPLLLRRHALACFFLGDRAHARRDWYGLSWRFPSELASAMAAKDCPDPYLRRQWSAFEDLDPALPVEDFPAWLLLADPTVAKGAPLVDPPDTPSGQAFRLIGVLSGAGTGLRPDADVIDLRRRLKDVHPRLFEIYLTRQRQGGV
jgi:hypothetical protein